MTTWQITRESLCSDAHDISKWRPPTTLCAACGENLQDTSRRIVLSVDLRTLTCEACAASMLPGGFVVAWRDVTQCARFAASLTVFDAPAAASSSTSVTVRRKNYRNSASHETSSSSSSSSSNELNDDKDDEKEGRRDVAMNSDEAGDDGEAPHDHVVGDAADTKNEDATAADGTGKKRKRAIDAPSDAQVRSTLLEHLTTYSSSASDLYHKCAALHKVTHREQQQQQQQNSDQSSMNATMHYVRDAFAVVGKQSAANRAQKASMYYWCALSDKLKLLCGKFAALADVEKRAFRNTYDIGGKLRGWASLSAADVACIFGVSLADVYRVQAVQLLNSIAPTQWLIVRERVTMSSVMARELGKKKTQKVLLAMSDEILAAWKDAIA